MNDAEAKLVEALRSGAYAQAQGRLRSPFGFCCLGVACDISGLGKWVPNEDDESFGYLPVNNESLALPHQTHLPATVARWLGWARGDGFIAPGTTLVSLNDSGKSFTEIADLIEAGLVRHEGDPE